jgi:hypothetical protein
MEAFPVEAEVNCGWGDTVVVIVMRQRQMSSAPKAADESPFAL